MGVIERMGYVDYFLIVADFIRWAKEQGIPVGPGRGSGAGSIAAYCMHITEIDPMQYALIFERFLNPERVSMPDFDTDFCQERRGEVIDYVTRKYGKDRVAQIVTFGTMAARGAVRDVGRALNMSYAETDVVAKAIPNELHMTLELALTKSPKLKEMYDGDPKVQKLIDTAMAIEGMPRNTSTHAAGVVITARPVSDYVPLARNEDTIVTQFTMTTIEELGLLKMDFLGLRNLTVIDDAEKEIRKTVPDFSIKNIPDDDPETFAMLGEGKTSGVFQLESTGITGRLRPDEAPVHRGYDGHRGPLPSGPHGVHSQVHPIQAPPGDHLLYHPPAPADPERHLRLHRLPGAGHRDLPQAGRLHPGPGGQYAPGHLQEEAERHRPGAAGLRLRRRGAGNPRRGGKRRQRGRRPRDLQTRSWTSPTTPSTRPTRSATPRSAIRPPGSNATIRCSTWRP